MKIIFSTDQIYLHGGLEKVMAQKANYFSEVLNYEVYILTTEQNNKPACYSLSPKIKLIDINVNYIRTKSYLTTDNLKKVFRHYRKWNEIIKRINPDILIVCNQAFDMFWTPFKFSGILKIREFHSSRYFEDISRKNSGVIKKIKLKVTDFVESKFDKIIVLNKDEQKFYKTKNTYVIPNPIVKQQLKAELVNKKAIAAGRIVPVKNFENLVDVWKLVVKEEPDWQLHIYGQGDRETISQLKSKIVSLGLETNIIIQNPTENIIQTMLDYSMYVLTSHTECFPMVLLESLSVGLPIVSYDCPTGPSNIITNGIDGFLVENKNTKILVEKILELIRSNDRRQLMGNFAKKNSDKFLMDAVMQHWTDLFTQLKK
ncbi:glycosyltransferase family 4 protein [Flavobacterium sp. MAHUQ-51]|uniref:glycosyltransferase family 4 protein n=1 Tax=Flavobacterium sp. GCM10022190 TaxID=3252639 RepID=UPI00361663FC